MNELITSFLIQSGECAMPGIGTLSRYDSPSVLHVADKELLPPVMQFQFTEVGNPLQEELIKYISNKKSITAEQAKQELEHTLTVWKTDLNEGVSIIFPSVGSMSKINGSIVFKEATPLFGNVAVAAHRVIHKNTRHAMVVGDKETDSGEMNELLNGETEETSRGIFWKIAAIILFLIGLSILIYHYTAGNYTHPFGNKTKIETKTPTPTYTQ